VARGSHNGRSVIKQDDDQGEEEEGDEAVVEVDGGNEPDLEEPLSEDEDDLLPDDEG
jgi:hypothetical protein